MKMLNSKQYIADRNGVKLLALMFLLFATCYLLSAVPALAQETPYNLLAPIPLSEGSSAPTETTTASEYIPGIVRLIIALAGALAVLKIIFAGIQYMSTDAFQGKNDAKSTISNALWGLALVIASWLILFTINPGLVKFNLEIKGVKQGPAFSTDLGRTPTTVDPDERPCEGCTPVLRDGLASTIGTSPPKGPGAGCEGTSVCYIYNDLAQSLVELTTNLKDDSFTKDIKWQVTEMFPPTRTHAHPCHNPDTDFSGKCVDAALRDLECANESCEGPALSRDAFKIGSFMKKASELGLVVVYEVMSNERRDQLIAAIRRNRGLNISTPLVIAPKKENGDPAINGEHFSVYLNDDVYRKRN